MSPPVPRRPGFSMRRPVASLLLSSLALVLTIACASAPSASPRPRFDASLITREQIIETQVTTAYDAVKTLRGTWLTIRGPESFRYPSAVQVYLDGVRLGDINALTGIAAPPIQYIRFYSPQDATAKWGIDHGAGAIYVSTKVGRGGVALPPA